MNFLPLNLIKKILRIDSYTMEESRAIYATNTISGLAQALLGIFIPMYIFSLSEKYMIFSGDVVMNGLIWVVFYYAASSLAVVLSIVIFQELIFEWTLKKTIFFSQFFLIFSYACLSLSVHSLYLIFLSAIFSGIHSTFYWIPYHIFFVKRVDDGDNKYGTETGRREFFLGLSTTLGPLLGALMIAQLGFPLLYGFAIILLLIATLPIMLFVQEQGHRRHSFKDVYFNYLRNKKLLKTTISLGGSSISYIVFVIFWSMMLFFGLKNFVEIGFMTTLSGIVALILLLLVGKITDGKRKLSTHVFGVVGNTLLHFTRFFFNSKGFLYASGILDNINSPFYGVPFNASIYEKSLEGSVTDFLIYRELVIHGIRFVVLIFIALFLFLTGSWTWVFFVGGLGSALTILVNF